MPRPSSTRRLLAATAAAAAGLAGGRALARRWRLLDPVAPGLRTPVLLLPLDVADRAVLRVARLVTAVPSKVIGPVTATTARVPGVGGAPAVRVLVYRPDERWTPSGALLWIHGGGLIMGVPEQANAWCSTVARVLGIVVVSVDYRLAPEHPFPAGLDDCLAALRWLHAGADDLEVDPARVAIGGESAGGGLAAALAQRARDEGDLPVAFQLLVYPMLDDRTVVHAQREGRDALVWTAASNRFAWTAYLGHEPSLDPERPYAAPARATDLAGLPPAWIGVGDIDLFHAEDVDYARRLEEAGVPCEVHVEPGMFHGADSLLGGRPAMVAFRRRAVAALRAGLAPAGSGPTAHRGR